MIMSFAHSLRQAKMAIYCYENNCIDALVFFFNALSGLEYFYNII